MNWTEVQIKTTAELEDLVSSILYDVGATGLAIEDPRDILELSKSEGKWDYVDPSLLDLDCDGITIKAYFSESEDLEDKIQYIRDKINTNPMFNKEENLVSISLVDDNDWAESWKKYYKPIDRKSVV